jgi:hypothetical protein
LVDGVDMISLVSKGGPSNNFVFCYSNVLDDGHHTLTVNAQSTGNQAFWLDRIDYIPSQQISYEQKTIGATRGAPGFDSSALTVFVFDFYGKPYESSTSLKGQRHQFHFL